MFLRHFYFAILAASISPLRCSLFLQQQIINNIRDSGYICAVLWLPGVVSAEASPWATNLPFPVQVWTNLGDKPFKTLKDYSAINRKVVVVVPASSDRQRATLLGNLREEIMFLPLVRFLFVLKPKEPIPNDHLRDVSCAVIFVNDTTIDAPENSHRNCSERTKIEPNRLFQTERQRRWTKLKGKSVIGCIEYINGRTGNKYGYGHSPYGPALMEAYQHLNISITPFISKLSYGEKYQKIDQDLLDVLHNKFDITFYLVIGTEQFTAMSHVGCITHMAPFVFYTAKGKRIPPGSHFGFRLLYFSGYISTLAVMFLVIHFLQGRFLKYPTSIPLLAVALWGLILGKYPKLPASLRNNITDMSLASWSIGVFFLSLYIQSDLTSEKSFPGRSKTIQTFDELEHVVRLGKLRPCVVRELFVFRYIMSANNGVLRTLKNSLMECGDDCFQNYQDYECFDRAREGTHAMVLLESQGVPKYMKYGGLSPGIDTFGMFPLAFMTSKSFRYLKEHDHIVRAMIETGLYVLHDKNSGYLESFERAAHATSSFEFRIILTFSYGCCISLVVLLLELAVRFRTSNCRQALTARRSAW